MSKIDTSFTFDIWTLAPAKKPADAPPPPPPPPPEEKKEADEEAEEEVQIYEFMGYKFPVPQLKIPEIPDWLRVILEYRFPSSIDPFTGEIYNQLKALWITMGHCYNN